MIGKTASLSSRDGRGSSPQVRATIGGVTWNVLLLVVVCCALVPVLWGFFLSLKTNSGIMLAPFQWPERMHWENYLKAFTSVPYGTMLKNTFIILAVALPASIIVEVLAAFAIGRMRIGRGRLQNAMYKYFIAGIILPGYVMLFPIYMISVRLNVYDTLWGVILPSMAGSASIAIMLLSAAFGTIPRELDEAAIVDGCGFMRLLITVLVPIVRPAIATMVILNFLGIWNNFPLARVLLNRENVRVISQAVMYFKGEYSTDYALTMAGTMILVVPQLIVFVFMQRYIVEGVTAGAVKA